MTGINLTWDWGAIGNGKLAEIFSNDEQIDFFCEYLINEMPIDELVAYMLRHAPIDNLKLIAADIGAFDIGEDGEWLTESMK
jgi:hypothetical protein